MDSLQNGIATALAGTRPWVRFLSVLGFLGAIMMLVIGLFFAAGGMFWEGTSTPSPVAALGIIYACMGLLYFVPALHLWRYGSAIEAYVRDPQTVTLEQALEAQRKFWKFVGVVALISILLMILGAVIPALILSRLAPGIGS